MLVTQWEPAPPNDAGQIGFTARQNFVITLSVIASQSAPAKGNVSDNAPQISGSSSFCKRRRARNRRVFTVSSGICRASAVSSTFKPSISRNTNTVLNVAGRRAIAASSSFAI